MVSFDPLNLLILSFVKLLEKDKSRLKVKSVNVLTSVSLYVSVDGIHKGDEACVCVSFCVYLCADF